MVGKRRGIEEKTALRPSINFISVGSAKVSQKKERGEERGERGGSTFTNRVHVLKLNFGM